MSAGEFAFLAFGLVLGIAAGAALLEVLRSRPSAPREVRLTVSQESVPRRPSTLASTAPLDAVGPAPFGPGDRRTADRPGAGAVPVGTSVPSPVPLPVDAVARPLDAEAGQALVPALIGITIEPEPDPVLAALGRPAVVGVGVAAAGPAAGPPAGGASGIGVDAADGPRALSAIAPDSGAGGSSPSSIRASGVAGPEAEGGGGPEAAGVIPGDAGPGAAAAEAMAGGPTGPCDELRRVAEERCAVAEGLARQAEAAAAVLRERQLESDEHDTKAAAAADECDPRLLRDAKEAAQHGFRVASASAASPADVEAAARTWLQEINRINRTAREAALTVRRERDAVAALVPVLERLSVEADAARINAESAREACLSAREAVAECEEAARRPAPVPAPPAPDASDDLVAASASAAAESGWDTGAGGGPEEEAGRLGAAAAAGLLAANEPVLFRLLAGDRIALRDLVERLAGDDPARRGAWQHELTELIDAISTRAVEASCLDFPVDHRFWGPFTREQCREIAAALASLGYRFDGAGGFVDDRIPSQRDLSLAVGFAGLDPMRIRRWPNEAEMPDLFREVSVAADEYVSGAAPGLTLGEMVTLLGRRADGLTNLWNDWGIVRPLLLASA